MTRGFELYRKWSEWQQTIPSLQEPTYGLIARTILTTGGKFDEVEFITGVNKETIFQVYQWVEEKEYLP